MDVSVESDPPPQPLPTVEVYLHPETELRFTTPPWPVGAQDTITQDHVVSVQLATSSPTVTGLGSYGSTASAEVFGCPLPMATSGSAGGVPPPLFFRPGGASYSIFSWTGALLRVTAPSVQWLQTVPFKAEGTHAKTIAELHCVLHAERVAAQQAVQSAPPQHRSSTSVGVGPRAIICGAPSAGKHTAIVTLANYAARLGWSPTVADADPEHQSLTLPGAVAAASWDYPRTSFEEAMHLPTVSFACGSCLAQKTGAAALAGTVDDSSAIPGSTPINAAFAHALTLLCQTIRQRLLRNVSNAVGWSGALVGLPPVADVAVAADMVARAVAALDATHVYVIGDDSLLHLCRQRFHAFSGGPGVENADGFVTPQGTRFLVEGVAASLAAVPLAAGSFASLYEAITRRREAAIRTYFTGGHWLMNATPHVEMMSFGSGRVSSLLPPSSVVAGFRTTLVPVSETLPLATTAVVKFVWDSSAASGASALRQDALLRLVAVTDVAQLVRESDRRLGAIYVQPDSPMTTSPFAFCFVQHVVVGQGGGLQVLLPAPLPSQWKGPSSSGGGSSLQRPLTVLIFAVQWGGEGAAAS